MSKESREKSSKISSAGAARQAPSKSRATAEKPVAAPDFTLTRDDGTTVSLSDFAGQWLVLYFYPRADTPGCTLEAHDFTRLAPSFAKLGAAVLGVSADPPKKLANFRTKHGLKVQLASDETHAMLDAFGAWGEKSMYGKTFLGVVRSTVLIDPKGRIRRKWPNVKVTGHAEEVLAALKSAQSE